MSNSLVFQKLALRVSVALMVGLPMAGAKDFLTNAVNVKNAPNWLRPSRIEKVIDRIQSKLEWSTRRVNLNWHSTKEDFKRVNGLGSMAAALTKTNGDIATIHLGPKVSSRNFDQVFAMSWCM